MNRSGLIAIARTWIGTPYHAGGAVKGVGCNCYGFFAGVVREAGMNVAESFSRLEGFADYPHFKTLLSGIRQTLIQVKEPQLGDVLLFNPAGGVAHVGFLSAPNMLIHADRVRKFVVEQRLPVRYHSAFKLPSIVDG